MTSKMIVEDLTVMSKIVVEFVPRRRWVERSRYMRGQVLAMDKKSLRGNKIVERRKGALPVRNMKKQGDWSKGWNKWSVIERMKRMHLNILGMNTKFHKMTAGLRIGRERTPLHSA